LTGTQLGNYGRDLGWTEQGPRRLLEALLERTSVPRIRLSSLQAQDIRQGLLDLWRDKRLCPHFHLPLQSGSDRVLAAMRRRYTAAQFLDAVAAIRAAVPAVAITTDVIAGFPGETEAEFEATLDLCREAGFAAMHCFPYSRRPQTGAVKMAGHLPPDARRQRLERLLDIARQSSEDFREAHQGTSAEVLWEHESDGLWQGLTGNYIRAYTAANEDLTNRLLPTRLQGLEAEGMRGTLTLTETASV
ncbi:MAG TPA: radical SAM protein, partial [Dehalococcoidia bacterium]|nr:radical SAM protein [Dehalococcoidia bacterium]